MTLGGLSAKCELELVVRCHRCQSWCQGRGDRRCLCCRGCIEAALTLRVMHRLKYRQTEPVLSLDKVAIMLQNIITLTNLLQDADSLQMIRKFRQVCVGLEVTEKR